MKYRFAVVPMALVCLAGTTWGQVIYDNGPLSTGTLTNSGVASPAGTTWSEVQGDTATCSNTSSGATCAVLTGGTTGFRLSDNFTIPAGQTWNLTGVQVYHYQTGASTATTPFNAATLRIWNGKPNAGGAVIFGDTTTNRMGTSAFASMYRIFNTTGPFPTAQGTTRGIFKTTINAVTSLGPGTYWIDWQSTAINGLTHFSPNTTYIGSPGPAGANSIQFNVQTATWVDIIDTGVAAGGTGGCHSIPQDLAFQIIGTVVAPPSCYADCDHVGGLTANDFQCFLNAFVAGASYANCDGVGGLTANDFQCFLDKYVAGCS